VWQPGSFPIENILTAEVNHDENAIVRVVLHWGKPMEHLATNAQWGPGGHRVREHLKGERIQAVPAEKKCLNATLTGLRVYALDAESIAAAVQLQPSAEIQPNGENLPCVLDRLRDEYPERFEAINEEIGRWIPEFDRILFDTPQSGHRAIALRTRLGQHKIAAQDISQGTLLALAILTLAYLPDPPKIVCFEEPGRGIHPRLLRDIKDAMYRLAYPESCGEKREPVQVIATTHSPYLLDLFRDHPDEIVIAEKLQDEQNVRFERLSDRNDLDQILEDSHLGDAWYSGILGGVPAQR
jgi:predicted ATPase